MFKSIQRIMFVQRKKNYRSTDFSLVATDHKFRSTLPASMEKNSKVGPQILAAFAGMYILVELINIE